MAEEVVNYLIFNILGDYEIAFWIDCFWYRCERERKFRMKLISGNINLRSKNIRKYKFEIKFLLNIYNFFLC